MDLFTDRPRSLRYELVSFLIFAVIFVGLAVLLDWDKILLWYGFGSYLLASVGRYAWWHFHPYQQPPSPPVTRYTR